jgi:hypothetical protein
VDIVFGLSCFQGPIEEQRTRSALRRLLDCLTGINSDYLRAHPETPWLYQSGVRYVTEPPGEELWLDIPHCLETGGVDCEDLACWRAAEIQVRHGIGAWADYDKTHRPDGSYLWHVFVKLPNGRKEDPSRVLGMR